MPFDTVFIDIGPDKKPPWYSDFVPTGQTPSAVIDSKIVWESVDILVALENHGSLLGEASNFRSLLPAGEEDRERVLRELRVFDSDDGPGVGSTGYTYMRGAPFGQTPAADQKQLDQLRANFEAKLCALEARLSECDGPFFEAEFGVLDVALWPVMERMAAGLPAFRGLDLRNNPDFPAVGSWLRAMGARPTVAQVASDEGTLLRLFTKVFGMQGAALPPDAKLAVGSAGALESAAKLVANREAVEADILEHGKLGSSDLDDGDVAAAVELAIVLVASRLAGVPPPDVKTLIGEVEDRAAISSVVAAALAFLRVRVSAPRDMSAAAAEQLRCACAIEAAAAFDTFGYV